jgi:microcystin-dependent protein
LFDKIYPIGSIYMSVNNVDPGTLFGGTWEQIKDQFLLASGNSYSLGSTGGAASVALTTSQMPSHGHYFQWSASNSEYNAGVSGGTNPWFFGNLTDEGHSVMVHWTYNGSERQGNTSNTGDGAAHNNMPPYLTVNVWKRTA